MPAILQLGFHLEQLRAQALAHGVPPKQELSVPRLRADMQVAAVGERLYAAICAHPGSAMATLAAELGATPRELNRPATQLKRAGRVRTVGQQQGTRYFPMSAKAAARA